MRRPYAIPTALTSLWRSPSKLLEPGDGVVIVFPDGSERHGTIESADDKGAVIEFPGGTVRAGIDWEGK